MILNSNEPEGRIREQLNAAGCTLSFCEGERASGNSLTDMDEFAVKASRFEAISLSFSNPSVYAPAIIMFTTGTTASSKQILQTHYNLVVNCMALVQHHRLDSGTTLLCSLPIYYANGLEFTIFATMLSGGHVLVCREFDPFTYLRTIDRYGVHIASVVPHLLQVLLEGRRPAELGSLCYFVSAAAPLSSQTARGIWNRFHRRIVQGYGLTETTNFSTLMPIDLQEDVYRKWMTECEIPSVGTEVFGNQVRILSPAGEELPNGEEGEICMRGHNVMAGYYNNPQATTQAFANGWFHSGDLGRLEVEPTTGRTFCTITGRIKNMIKVGGQAVSLEEIDRLVQQIPGILEAVACPIPHPVWGEVAGCLVVAQGEEITQETVLHALRQRLAAEKIPRHIRFLSKIPRSPNGKVNRKLLTETYFKG